MRSPTPPSQNVCPEHSQHTASAQTAPMCCISHDHAPQTPQSTSRRCLDPSLPSAQCKVGLSPVPSKKIIQKVIPFGGMNPFTFCYLFASSSYEAGAVPGASRGDEDTWGPCPLDPNAERGHEISKEEESLPLNVPRSCRGPPRRKVAWGPGPHC